MSAVENPIFGLYGTWESEHPECVETGLDVTSQTKMIQLLFASICLCQVFFMASRAPRVTWEAVYLPVVETVLYGLAASGNGNMRLADGRMVPIARYCSWLITCPIMLLQVVAIHDVKWWNVSTRYMVLAASLIRTVFGIGASVSTNETMRWVQFGLACACFLFEMVVCFQTYKEGLKKFKAVKTTLNSVIYARLLFLRSLFFVSWNSFPIIWVLSSTGLCIISEDASVLSYLIADMICKNMYGITNANTLFRVLDGAWVAETEEHTQAKDHLTYLEMMMTHNLGLGHHEDVQMGEIHESSGGVSDGSRTVMKTVRVDLDDQGSMREGAGVAQQADPSAHFSPSRIASVERPKARVPDMFVDENSFSRLDSSMSRTRGAPEMSPNQRASIFPTQPAPQRIPSVLASYEEVRGEGSNRSARRVSAIDRDDLLDFARRLVAQADTRPAETRRPYDGSRRRQSLELAQDLLARGRSRERPSEANLRM